MYKKVIEILVFETNISKRKFSQIKDKLNKILTGTEWNIDFADNQNILRVETNKVNENFSEEIANKISSEGFLCKEL